MTQFSFPWPETSNPQVGDGRKMTDAEFATFLQAVFGSGVIPVGNMLAVTAPGPNQLSVNTGCAIVGGRFVVNDATVNLAPASASAGSTRKDSVILEVDWTGGGSTGQYTVRVVTKEGSAGTYPSLTQTPNVLWQERLYNYDIDDAGVISNISDQRSYAAFNSRVLTAMCAPGLLSADTAGRELMASGYFNNATLLAKIVAGAFQADANTRALFADGIWTNAKLAPGVGPTIGDIKENAAATLGGSDGRRMVVGGVAYESWVHCDGGEPVNGVTIPDLRNKVLAGASMEHPAGSTGGADTIDLSHVHKPGTLAVPNHTAHTHGGGTLFWPHRHNYDLAHVTLQAGTDPRVKNIGSTYEISPWEGTTSATALAHGAITGSTGEAGSATQDNRQATVYVHRFIYVG